MDLQDSRKLGAYGKEAFFHEDYDGINNIVALVLVSKKDSHTIWNQPSLGCRVLREGRWIIGFLWVARSLDSNLVALQRTDCSNNLINEIWKTYNGRNRKKIIIQYIKQDDLSISILFCIFISYEEERFEGK